MNIKEKIEDIYHFFKNVKNSTRNFIIGIKRWWDNQPQSYKNSTTRPGGTHQRVIVGK